MAYSADTFVADEQPTTAKWNKLWTNDASFNDGSGIADDAILYRHIAANNVKSDNLALSNALDSTNGVQSQANAGSAGGTMYYINLGGMKLCWGFTSTLTAGASSPSSTGYSITLPTSFFSSIQHVSVTAVGGTATNTQYTMASPNGVVSTSTVSFYFSQLSGGSGSTSKGHFLVIGT